MQIVDAQVHVWGADTPARPWPPGRAHQAQKPYPVTADMVLAGMREAGVDRAVLTSLRMLYEDPSPDSSDDVASRLEGFNRRLCSDIRQGAFSSKIDEKRLRDHLRRSVEARVAISNPKALKG